MTGLTNKVTVGDTSPLPIALASHNGLLAMAWRGDGNDNLNLMVSADGGRTFGGKKTFDETSTDAPALASFNGNLFMAWKGDGNDNLNVAKVVLFGNTNGGAGVEGLSDKATFQDTSPRAPTLVQHGGRLFLGWKGDGNDNLNVAQVAF